MLIDLRDSLAAIYEDVSVIIKQPPAELERVRKPRSAAPFLVVLAVVATHSRGGRHLQLCGIRAVCR